MIGSTGSTAAISQLEPLLLMGMMALALICVMETNPITVSYHALYKTLIHSNSR